MKKLIAIVSVSATFLFAAALANAHNNTDTTTSNTDSTMSAPMNNDDSASQKAGVTSEETKTTVQYSKHSKTCVDDNGTTFRKGQTGFKTCMKAWKSKSHDQMSGSMGSDTDVHSNANSGDNLMTNSDRTAGTTASSNNQ